MLATSVALMDIADVEGFVAATLKRSGIRFTPDEHEDLMAEGLAILYQLAQQWQPRMPGHQQDGRFSGYAAMMLPKRLTDAWHKMHREHTRLRSPGKRQWVYGEPAVSLDAVNARRDDFGESIGDTRGFRDTNTATEPDDETQRQEFERIAAGITQAARATADDALRYSVLISAGFRPADARARLGIDPERGRALHALIVWAGPFVSGATCYVEPQAA